MIYGILDRQEEVQLAAEIKLHTNLPITRSTRREIESLLAVSGVQVVSVQRHEAIALELN